MTTKVAEWYEVLGPACERVQNLTTSLALGGERTRVIGRGASGDKTLVADKTAEDELIRAIGKVEGVRVLSEEAGEAGDPKGKSLAVVDPVDGSANFERGIPFYCTSVAIAGGTNLEDVTFAIVRNLVNGDEYTAEKGRGAKKNGKQILSSAETEPARAVVDIDMSRGRPELLSGLGSLVAGVRRQVHFGANALELCLLAEGRIDSFVDLRGKMRVTDFAGAFLIAKESGAVVTGAGGEMLNPRLSLDERFSFVASGNRGLHGKILELCASGKAGARGRR